MMDANHAAAFATYVLGIGFLAIFAIVILKMLQNRIDLSQLVAEAGLPPKASLSRFQFFVFTFVVGGLFLILSLENGQIIEIPNSVLGLLGISGGSYLISKGMSQSSAPTTLSQETIQTKKETLV
jgi:hypothetical protein